MRETNESKYVKRTQKDYSYAFKLSVVREVENGELGITAAAQKYGIQNSSTVTNWLRKHGNSAPQSLLDLVENVSRSSDRFNAILLFLS